MIKFTSWLIKGALRSGLCISESSLRVCTPRCSSCSLCAEMNEMTWPWPSCSLNSCSAHQQQHEQPAAALRFSLCCPGEPPNIRRYGIMFGWKTETYQEIIQRTIEGLERTRHIPLSWLYLSVLKTFLSKTIYKPKHKGSGTKSFLSVCPSYLIAPIHVLPFPGHSHGFALILIWWDYFVV